MEIIVKDGTCWVCGRHISLVKKLTDHHTLPKHLNPKKNFVCPVCQECHDKINYVDHTGLVNFAFKIQKSFDELTEMAKNMIKNLKDRGEK